MEEEKMGEQGKNGETEKRKGTGEQYLYALIRCAEWVDKPYKVLAEKNKTRPEVMKELYLCACDGVPIEKAIEAVEKNPPEGALRLIRRKYLENSAMDEYQEQITGIKKTTATLEKEVRQMSGMIKHIAEHVPDFDSMFPPDENVDIVQENEKAEKNSLEEGGQENQEDGVPEFGTPERVLKNVPDSGTGKKDRFRQFSWESLRRKYKIRRLSCRLPWKKEKKLAEFIEKLLDAGYSKEQLDYLLDCLEEGVPIEKLEKFSSPKLPVEVMQRLRSLEERKE